MKREEVHAAGFHLLSVPLRQHGPLEEGAQFTLERTGGKLRYQPMQADHRRGVAFLRGLVRADLEHQVGAAEPFDQLVHRRDGNVVSLLALVVLEATAEAAQRETPSDGAEHSRLVAQRRIVAQREGDAKLIELADERRLARVSALCLIQSKRDFREGDTVVERSMRVL